VRGNLNQGKEKIYFRGRMGILGIVGRKYMGKCRILIILTIVQSIITTIIG
jgi:hypothetical protein